MKQMQKRTCMGIVLLILTLTMTACSTETIELIKNAHSCSRALGDLDCLLDWALKNM